MIKSDTIQNLAKSLAAAQAEMKPAPFNATNPFLKNKYADLGAIIETARPVLQKYGLAVTQLTVSEGEQIGVTTMLVHASGEYIGETMMMTAGEERGKSDAQVAGSIISYLRRYSLASILGMYADEDTDGHTVKANGNGNGHAPEHAQEAAAIVTDSKDKAFADMTVPELAGHLTEYSKRLKDNPQDEVTLAKYNEAKIQLDAKKGK